MTQTAIALLAEVTNKLNTEEASIVVRERIFSKLIEKELDNRVCLLDQSLNKMNELKESLAKIRPDIETFNADGIKADSQYSKAKFEEKRKATERLALLEQAIERALMGGSEEYNKLKEVMGKMQSSPEKKKPETYSAE